MNSRQPVLAPRHGADVARQEAARLACSAINPRHDLRLLDIWQMTRALNDLKARAGDERRRFLNQGDGRGAVLIADQAKGRRLDPPNVELNSTRNRDPLDTKVLSARQP